VGLAWVTASLLYHPLSLRLLDVHCVSICVRYSNVSHAICNTGPFDRAEKDTRDTGDELEKLGWNALHITLSAFRRAW